MYSFFKTPLLVIFFLISLNGFGQQSKPINLEDAIQNNAIEVKPKAEGGLGKLNLKLILKNLTNKITSIRIRPGLHFKAQDPTRQDLFTYEELTIVLQANQERSVHLTGFCMNAFLSGPRVDGDYTFMGFAPKGLHSLGDSLNKYKAIGDDYGQMLVWSVTDNKPIYQNITVQNKYLQKGFNNIIRYLYALANKPNSQASKMHQVVLEAKLPKVHIGPEPSVKTFSKQSVLAFHNPTDQVGTIQLFDARGQLKHTFYQNKQFIHGLNEFPFGINETVPLQSEPVYYVRAITKQGKKLAEVKVDKNTREQEINARVKSFTIAFNLDRGYREVKLSIYLPDGSLLEEIKKYEYLPVGSYELKADFRHMLPANTAFIAKLEWTNGKVLKQMKINPDVHE